MVEKAALEMMARQLEEMHRPWSTRSDDQNLQPMPVTSYRCIYVDNKLYPINIQWVVSAPVGYTTGKADLNLLIATGDRDYRLLTEFTHNNTTDDNVRRYGSLKDIIARVAFHLEGNRLVFTELYNRTTTLRNHDYIAMGNNYKSVFSAEKKGARGLVVQLIYLAMLKNFVLHRLVDASIVLRIEKDQFVFFENDMLFAEIRTILQTNPNEQALRVSFSALFQKYGIDNFVDRIPLIINAIKNGNPAFVDHQIYEQISKLVNRNAILEYFSKFKINNMQEDERVLLLEYNAAAFAANFLEYYKTLGLHVLL